MDSAITTSNVDIVSRFDNENTGSDDPKDEQSNSAKCNKIESQAKSKNTLKTCIIHDCDKELSMIHKSPNSNVVVVTNAFIETGQEEGIHTFKETHKNVAKTRRKRLTIVDTDSSDEESNNLNKTSNTIISTYDDKTNSSIDSDDEDFNVLKCKSIKRTIGYRDLNEEFSEDESVKATTFVIGYQDDSDTDISNKLCKNITKPMRKILAIVDTDSEEETITSHNVSYNSDLSSVTNKNEESAPIRKPDRLLDSNDYQLTASRVSALCDEDSDDDNTYTPTNDDYKNSEDTPITRRVKKGLSREITVQKKMTAKQAMQQREEIRSASQRRQREMPISLPYHKPKARSIKEFLQNRPRLSLSLVKETAHTPPSLALKMTTQELELVTKKLEERVKMVKEFYVSESDSDDDSSENIREATDEISGTTNLNVNTAAEMDNINANDEFDKLENENVENVSEKTESGNAFNDGDSSVVMQDKNLLETYNRLDNTDACIENNGCGNFKSLINNDFNINNNLHKCTNLEGNSTCDDLNTPTVAIEKEKVLQDTPDTNVIITTEGIRNEKSVYDGLASTSNNTQNNTCCIASELQANDSISSESTPHDMEFTVQRTDSKSANTMTEDSKTENLTIEIQVKSPTCDTNENSCMEVQHSEEFDFNLDDLEEAPLEPSATNIEEDHLQRLLKKYSTGSTDNNQPGRLSTLDLLKQQVGDFKPFLSGSPDEDIDLEHGITKPNKVSLLVKRFMKHNVATNQAKQKVELDVINLTQGEFRRETVAMSVDPEEEPIKTIEIPGSKLRKLKQELQIQIAQQRSELWQQKLQLDKDNGTYLKDINEKSNEANADEILDDEEEAELTDAEVIDDEYENVDENDVAATSERRREASEFIDEEAEETDADDEYDENEDADGLEVNDQDDDTNENHESALIKKPLRRILKGFTEDSDEEDDRILSNSKPKNSLDDDDDLIPPNLPRLDTTPLKPTQQSSQVDFLTPLNCLTGLENLNSGSKFLEESPAFPNSDSMQQSTRHQSLQKKLFTDSCDTSETKLNSDGVAPFCLESFSATQAPNIPTTQDLLDICSGSFSLTCINKNKDGHLDVHTQKTVIRQNILPTTEMKTLNEDKLISELLDEEEMEQFKKKFESPVEPRLSATIIEQSESEDEVHEVQGGGIILSDCSDDENVEIKTTSTKKLKKKLDFSDDESSNNEDDCVIETEEIDLHDNISDIGDDENHEVDYDSEENEIDSSAPAINPKLADFLENEAELSESEWGSDDEDERGLDVLEAEQGDADVFDENQMRNDLERIHMRRVLDQDNQEIKMLQELLLEDGELHGTGRQRQFRWNNIDYGDDNQLGNKPELDVYLEGEECEEAWRRARHEREMFFKKNQQKLSGIEDDITLSNSNSQIIKLGQEALRKSQSLPHSATAAEKCHPAGFEIKTHLGFTNTRGSFLARTDKFLTKLAEFSKVSTETVLKTTKNPKGFIFQTLASDNDINEKKRKAADKTNSIIKKLRLSKDSTSPSIYRKKKLF